MKSRNFFYGLTGLVLLSGMIFTGCENFLNGENIKEQIKRDIYIANNECPVANVEEPAFSDSGVARNKAIVISFTKAIKPETFNTSYSITDSQGNNLKDNFLEPEWSNENKLVTIPANEQNYIDLRGKRTLDIYFTLSDSCETPDGLPIKNAVNHKYRINDTIDNTPPTITENCSATRTAISFNGYQISPASELFEGAITSDNEWQICSINHINSEMNVYIEGSDYGGGTVKGHVVAKRVRDTVGNTVNDAVMDFHCNLTKQDDSDNSSGICNVNLSSSSGCQDGLYEIKVYVQDSANLDSEEYQTYYVIRDTSLAYCITSRLVNDTSLFRNDIPEPSNVDSDNNPLDPIYFAWLQKKRTFDMQTPTLRKIKDSRTRILFDQINDDVYYTSSLTQNTYAENDLTYFVCWGLDNEHLTAPVRIEGRYYSDLTITPNDSVKYYTLPQTFIDFINDENNQKSDIILKAIVLDCVGNQNVITSLWPKTIDFYHYTVNPDTENTGKKKVELNFSNLAVNDTFEDKKIHGKYRIFYAPWGTYAQNEELPDLELKRNCDQYKPDSDNPDLLVIKNLEQNSKYVVYVQTAYDAESTYNGQYNSTTFGPLKKLIIDTNKTSGGTLTQPVFTVTKIGGEKNSGLYTLEININDSTYDPNLKYVPYYWDVIKLAYWENNIYHPDEWGWLKLESHTEQSFNITINNHLMAPLKVDTNKGITKLWACKYWDCTPTIGDDGEEENTGADNTYYRAVENCMRKKGYPSVPAKVKIVAVNDTDEHTDVRESAEVTFEFNREDDTISPKVSSDITKHDSHLSYDGHCFEFSDLITEDEGNLTEYFTYYYTPYNPAWADNLNVLSEDQIKMLPSGRAKFTGTCWLEPNETNPEESGYRLDTSIPVNGLPDGDYMYFAKLDDRLGNYTYATLGKAHIGTFKNKLKVSLDEDGKYFISTLELEPDESFFDRNMISVQSYWDNWDNYYEWMNELQNCKKTTIDGKLCLRSHIIDDDDPNIFVYRIGAGGNSTFNTYQTPRLCTRNTVGNITAVTNNQKTLDKGKWYRITMQSFNENSMTARGADGVSFKYGRPYTTVTNCEESDDDDNYHNLWNRNLWWVDGEQKYDVCTEETVSNTVYYYVPSEWDETIPGVGTVHRIEEFSDYYASFFSSTATPRSNHSILVNVFASYRDLGNDPDEWERRGKLVATHRYSDWDDSSSMISCDFNQGVAAEDVSKAREQGLVYYAAVVHFAKGESAVSDVYTMYGF